MPNGGMYAPPAGHPRSQADRSADDAVIARRSQTSQDDVCATQEIEGKKPRRRKSAEPHLSETLRYQAGG